MTYNSIYSNIFKLQNQNNLMNIPEFFLKLIVRMKKTGAKKTKMILSRSQNKKEIRNVDSVGNSKNNTLIKKYDLILNKKNEIIDKRKSSAFRIIKLKRPDKKPKSKIEFLTAKKKEKSAIYGQDNTSVLFGPNYDEKIKGYDLSIGGNIAYCREEALKFNFVRTDICGEKNSNKIVEFEVYSVKNYLN